MCGSDSCFALFTGSQAASSGQHFLVLMMLPQEKGHCDGASRESDLSMRATAWVLDIVHRVRRVECDVPAGTRALVAIRRAAQRVLAQLGDRPLDDPVGVRTLDGDPEFLFLVSSRGEGTGWMTLSELAAGDERGFSLYIDAMLGGWRPPTRDLDVFYFGNTPEMAARLAHAVVKGVKRGTTGWVAAAEHDGSTIPHVGTVSIVTDGFGYAQCAIQSERIERLRFRDVDARHAWAEGEADRSLEDWREGHQRYFASEGAQLGLTFTEDAELFFEHFRLLAVFGRPDS